MKKLMIAAAIVLAAVASQASTIKWSAANLYKQDTVGSEAATDKFLGTVYLFNAIDFDFDAMVKNFNKTVPSGSAGSITMWSAGSVPNASQDGLTSYATTYGSAGADYSVFFVAVDGDYLFVSNIKGGTQNANDKADTNVAFGSQKDASQAKARLASEGYKGTGWYQAVPEPTSALLMLLGMAGLALKRKQA